MSDIIVGPITRIIGTNSFQMQVTDASTHNSNPYSNYETIYVEDGQPSINNMLFSILLIGKRVRCMIKYRDNNNRLVATVEYE